MDAGIYIHIPFCKQACHYCNFHFSTSLKNKTALLDAIACEIDLRKIEWQNTQFKSIYIGGGTPSLLNNLELKQLFGKIKRNFHVSENAEITLEANPDDLNKKYLEELKDTGINRLSIGIQSFRDRDLIYMNRAHNAKEALDVVWLAKKAGFEQISIDLIYGVPGMSESAWLENLEHAAAMPINHISCYALTLEPNTALNHFVKSGKSPAPDEALASKHFELLTEKVAEKNWDHYEISNIAIDGQRAIHNSSYWNGTPYFGLGPAAHSYDGKNKRFWNISNNSKYIKGIKTGSGFWKGETLSNTDRFNEKLMTGLRQKEGINYEELNALFKDNKQKQLFLSNLYKLGEKELLEKKDNRWTLTKKSLFLADHVVSELFLV
ncbi:MAG: radical SAM family heme chaperone HemW [Chitinophagales bacterium]